MDTFRQQEKRKCWNKIVKFRTKLVHVLQEPKNLDLWVYFFNEEKQFASFLDKSHLQCTNLLQINN